MRRSALALVLPLLSLGLAGCRGGPASGPSVIALDKTRGAGAPGATPLCSDTSSPLLGENDAYGLKIEAICIEGASPRARKLIETKLGLAPGAVLTEAGLRTGLAQVHATDVADELAAHARRAGSRVTLFVVIRERPRVGKVEVEGARAASITVKQAPHPTALQPGEYFDPVYTHERAEALRAMYVKEGFEEAAVTPKTSRSSEGLLDIRMVIVEGTRSRAGTITFRGVRRELEAPLLAAIEIKKDEPLSPDKLERAPLLASAFYYDRGFLDVRVDFVRGERDKDGAVPLTYAFVEGEIYRVGKISLTKHGLDDKTARAIVAKLKSKPGNVFNRSLFVADVESVRQAYADRGRSVKVEVMTNLDKPKKSVDVELEIADGSP